MPNESSPKSVLRSLIKKKLIENAPYRREKSERIWRFLSELDVFVEARNRHAVMGFVDFQNEVETFRFFERYLNIPPTFSPVGPMMIVPYCVDREIVPFVLRGLDELEPGFYGIPEPKKELRDEPGRTASLDKIELVLVPGLAFDAEGNRLGRGAGYYDRFLAKLPKPTKKVALAFECQIVDAVPSEPHDIRVDYIVTDKRIIPI